MKTEPSVGNFIATAARFAMGNKKLDHSALGNKKLDHSALVDDALAAFTVAEKKMETAIDQINDEIASEEKVAREAEARIQDAKGSKEKITRVLHRIKALTA